MKKIAGFVLVIALLTTYGFKNASVSAKAKDVKFTVNYTFTGIEEGYDHDSKTELYINDKLVATSSVKKESEKNSVSTVLPKGTYKVRVVNYAYYEGTWEEHTIANNYSIDCLYESTIDMKKKKNTLNLLFDINSGTQVK
jgi:hypothetical protein